MTEKLIVAPHIYKVIERLQSAGFETYVVGGAIRDLMLGRPPKDYDISTEATPAGIWKTQRQNYWQALQTGPPALLWRFD